MNLDKIFSAKTDLTLSGKLGGFQVNSLTIPLLLAALLFLFTLVPATSMTQVGFYVVLGLIVLWVAGCAWINFRSRPRSADGEASSFQVEYAQGHKINYLNPPDSLFDPENQRAIARGFVLGFDANLTPDGEVIGNASEKKFRVFSDEEKTEFRRKHAEEITRKININQIENESNDISLPNEQNPELT